jgi:hypothetical protein
MSDCGVHPYLKLQIPFVCSRFQIRFYILVKPLFRECFKLDRRCDLSSLTAFLEQYRLPLYFLVNLLCRHTLDRFVCHRLNNLLSVNRITARYPYAICVTTPCNCCHSKPSQPTKAAHFLTSIVSYFD